MFFGATPWVIARAVVVYQGDHQRFGAVHLEAHDGGRAVGVVEHLHALEASDGVRSVAGVVGAGEPGRPVGQQPIAMNIPNVLVGLPTYRPGT